MAELGSLSVSLSLDAQNFNQTVSQANRHIKSMGEELKSVKAKGLEYSKSVQGLARQKEILNRSVEASALKLKEERRRYDELANSGKASAAQIERQAGAVNKAQTQHNRLSKQLADVSKELQVQSSKWTQLGDKMTATGSKMKTVGDMASNVGKKMSVAITAPIIGAGAAAIKVGADFQEGMSKVAAVSGAAGEDFESLKAKARELGAATQFSAKLTWSAA